MDNKNMLLFYLSDSIIIIPSPCLIRTHFPVFEPGELNCSSLQNSFTESIKDFRNEIEYCHNQLVMCKQSYEAIVKLGQGALCNMEIQAMIDRLNSAANLLRVLKHGAVAVKSKKNIRKPQDLLRASEELIITASTHFNNWTNFQMIVACREEYVEDLKSKYEKMQSDWNKILHRFSIGMYGYVGNVSEDMISLGKDVASVTSMYSSYDPDMNSIEACFANTQNLFDKLVLARKDFEKVLNPFDVKLGSDKSEGPGSDSNLVSDESNSFDSDLEETYEESEEGDEESEEESESIHRSSHDNSDKESAESHEESD